MDTIHFAGDWELSTGMTSKQPHIIVCGDEIGGSGKTTIAMHLIVGLLNKGFKVASIDLNSSLTRYLDNRKAWSSANNRALAFPSHHRLDRPAPKPNSDEEDVRYRELAHMAFEVEGDKDFVIIDTSGTKCFLTHFANQMADTLITPINGSFADHDALGHADIISGTIDKFSQFAAKIRETRSERRGVHFRPLDWLVVRNRMYQFRSRNSDSILHKLDNLSSDLRCRFADGISERPLFRELFEKGLTVLDYSVPEVTNATLLHTTARHEVRSLISALDLPIGQPIAEPIRKPCQFGSPKPVQNRVVRARANLKLVAGSDPRLAENFPKLDPVRR